MSSYMDKTYAAIDGVLLSYTGKEASLRLPVKLADMRIRTVGRGAVMESEALQQVVVPQGVEHIGELAFARCGSLADAYLPYTAKTVGKDAFFGCRKLVSLFIYGITLSEQQYSDLRAASARVNGSEYLASVFPSAGIVQDAVNATEARPANAVPKDIARLFTTQSLKDEGGASSLERDLDGFGFSSPERYATERDAFTALLADRRSCRPDAASEEKNDQFVKTEKYPEIKKTAVFTFSDAGTEARNGVREITGEIRIGYHFWQSKVPVAHDGKTYYIYRRHYLCAEPGLNYIRRDVGVFTAGGCVVNKWEAQEVYAKYKLLSIL